MYGHSIGVKHTIPQESAMRMGFVPTSLQVSCSEPEAVRLWPNMRRRVDNAKAERTDTSFAVEHSQTCT